MQTLSLYVLTYNAPKQFAYWFNTFDTLPYAVGSFHYFNWPILFSKQGNRTLFLENVAKFKHESVWARAAFYATQAGQLRTGCLLATPILHHRKYAYRAQDRIENEYGQKIRGVKICREKNWAKLPQPTMLYDQYLLRYIPQSSDGQHNGVGLAGELGKIVSALYAAHQQEDEAAFEQNFEALTTLINEIYGGQHPLMMNATLDNGLTGLGLALHCLLEDGLIENNRNDGPRNDGPLESLLTDIDAFVFAGAKKYFSRGNHVLGEGGLYYLTIRQDKNPAAKKYVAALVKAEKKCLL